ncbi:MAG: hypothetical protein OSJ52_12860 [Lachnospiraceae bacterium]|nr:hypothetical protein [Lachnospiraceae bacterium]
MGRTGETIKVIPANNGELYMISGGRRYHIARFHGRVEIEEKQMQVAILGTLQKGTKRILASFVICGDIDFQKSFGFDSVDSGKVFEIQAGVGGERMNFAGLRFEDSDPLTNELIFEIPDLELIQTLLVKE